MIKSNENEIWKNEKLKKKLFTLLLHNNDAEINKLTLDVFGILSKFLQLDENNDTHVQYLNKIINCLNSSSSEEKESSVENLHNLMMNQENETIIENKLDKFVSSLVKLLLTNSLITLEKILEIMCHFSDLKMATRVVFSRQKDFFSRLIALIAGNTNKNIKIAKLSSIILDNISVTPGTRVYLKPYEYELFMIASSEDSVSKTLCQVLERLKTVNWNLQDDNQKFYKQIEMEIESF